MWEADWLFGPCHRLHFDSESTFGFFRLPQTSPSNYMYSIPTFIHVISTTITLSRYFLLLKIQINRSSWYASSVIKGSPYTYGHMREQVTSRFGVVEFRSQNVTSRFFGTFLSTEMVRLGSHSFTPLVLWISLICSSYHKTSGVNELASRCDGREQISKPKSCLAKCVATDYITPVLGSTDVAITVCFWSWWLPSVSGIVDGRLDLFLEFWNPTLGLISGHWGHFSRFIYCSRRII